MIDRICKYINNYFDSESFEGDYSITNQVLDEAGFLSVGEYYRITGSRYNDGVHVHPALDLQDESFSGTIFKISLPKDFIKLADNIREFCRKNGEYTSVYLKESFGGYSYTKLTTGDGSAPSWQNVFKKELNMWRKI